MTGYRSQLNLKHVCSFKRVLDLLLQEQDYDQSQRGVITGSPAHLTNACAPLLTRCTITRLLCCIALHRT